MDKTDLFDLRLLFVVGKGGVGKTAISAAIGTAAAQFGKKVLLVEAGETDAMGAMFQKASLSPEPSALAPGISGSRISPKAVLEEYVHTHVGIGFIANRITGSRLFDHLAEATPGLKEIMTLGQIWRWEKRLNETGEYLYDMVVVDCPSTGHGLSLLRQPRTLVEMLRFGPIARQTLEVQKLLMNRSKTGLILVTLPEELPVNEAVEFIRTAENDMDMPVTATVVNSVLPVRFTDSEAEKVFSVLETAGKNGDEGLVSFLEPAALQITRRRNQNVHLAKIRREARGRLTEIPFYYTDRLDGKIIRKIAAYLVASYGR